MRALAAATVVVSIAFAAPAAAAEFGISGTACVKDGDTLVVPDRGRTRSGNCRAGREVRLEGLDAPEWKAKEGGWRQTCRDGQGRFWACGRAAFERLVEMVGGGAVTCQIVGYDWRYKRDVGVCLAGGRHGGYDVGRVLVEEGLAVVHPDYDQRYANAEARARAAGLGMWAGDFTPPWEWRRARKTRK